MISKKRLLGALFISCFILIVGNVFAQRTVTGTVTDDKGVPLVGANVIVKGNKPGNGTQTNAKGEFSISVPADAKTLEVSYLGHATRQVNITGKQTVEVVLPLLIGSLDTVVTVGYVTQKRKDVTGAISSVKGEEIKNLPTQNIAEALQGRMSGVEVIKESAEPGSKSAQITIRGVSSLSQPDPLYVIDGVIQSNKSGGANINPQDIATIDVLKDASAAAIYGSSAAGGVIIITTKKGSGTAKPTINFNARYGITVPMVFKLLNKDEFLRYKSLTDPNGYYSYLTPDQLKALPDYDWVKALFSNGTEENYNLSLSGKTSAADFYISGVYNKQKGIFLENASEYEAIRINTDVKVTPKVKIGEQIFAWHRRTTPIKTSIVVDPFRTVPTASPYSGNPEYPWSDFPGGYQGVNVMAQIKTANFEFPEYTFNGNAYIEAKLRPKYLTFKATVGYTYAGWENNLYYGTYNTSAAQNLNTLLYRANGKWEQMLNAFILAYDHTYGGIHTLNLLAGYENYQNMSSSLSTSASSVAGTSYGYILTSGSARNLSGGYDPNGLVRSFFGRINYDFDRRIITTINFRRDGNYTTFGPTHQHGNFPSVSTGWKMSEERFFKKMFPYVSQFKIRAGWGSFGNSNIPAYRYTTTFAVPGAQSFSNNGNPLLGYTQELIANKDVKWESMYETNIGIDGDMFNGKLYFTFDWYDKRTKDMLYWVPVPNSVGIPPRYEQIDNVWYQYPAAFLTNIGSVKNTGVDILIGYKNAFKKLNYNVSFTGSINKNEVLSLDKAGNAPIINYAANSNYPATDNSIWVNQPLTYTEVGKPFGQFYGYKVLGMFKTDDEAAQYHAAQPNAKAGDLHFWDKDGNGIINDADKTTIGNPYPKFTFGVNANLSWKRFDLALLFNGVMGVDIYNGVAPYTMSLYDGGNVTSKIFGASFLGNNGLTSQPRIGGMDGLDFVRDPNGNYSKANSYFVEDGSYVKLKNIQIGYTLPDRLLQKYKLKSTRFYLMGNNVFVITKYSGIDPELGGVNVITKGIDKVNKYPNARIFSMGVDITL